MSRFLYLPFFAVSCILLMASCTPEPSVVCDEIGLNSNWRVFSSEVTDAGGDVISLPGFSSENWYSADIPSTVLSALRQNGYYSDIYFADNLLQVETSRFEVVCDLSNPGDILAFFIELAVIDSEKDMSVLPVFWEDNYISLLPGEKRRLRANVDAALVDVSDISVRVKGWHHDNTVN